ncbi:hypothetical protein V5O48_007386 [Marasmius crinis-equi]|uniref:F-box domain-containing protein n=1 Tax=Marasmius crinis-equi TaxID=585013 RepID=A0ABR3FGV0_9AGAR
MLLQMTITIGGVEWKEPLLELRPVSTGETSQISTLDVLRQFHVPSPDEKGHVIALIAVEERAVVQLEASATGVQPDSHALEVHKVSLTNRIKELRHVISAVRRLPFEVLELILSLICECGQLRGIFEFTSGDTKAPCDCRRKMPGYPLSQVSLCWNKAVEHEARLWSRMFVNFDRFPAQMRPLLETYIRNARDYPLKIRLFGGNAGAAAGWDTFHLLFSRFPQCKQLDLNLSQWFIQVAFPPFQPSVPGLGCTFTHLTNLTVPGMTMDKPRWFWDAVRSAPNLKHVSMRGAIPVQPSVAEILPYAQLTSLQIKQLTETPQNNLTMLFPRCTSLKVLKIGYFDPLKLEESEVATVIEMPCLEELEIGVNFPRQFPDHLNPIFSRFAFPSLRILKVSPVSRISKIREWPVRFAPSFERSATSIERISLDFDGPNLPPSEEEHPLLPIIRAARNVKRLDIRWKVTSQYGYAYDWSPVLDLVKHFNLRMPGNQGLAPHLEEFFIQDEVLLRLQEFNVLRILEMVESRAATLKTFEMIYGPPPETKESESSGVRDSAIHYQSGYMDWSSAENARRIEDIRNQGVRFTVEQGNRPRPEVMDFIRRETTGP